MTNTKTRALVEARSLLQSYGFNGFSFQHLADRLYIKKPSLYVHFKTKEELGNEILKQYRNEFKEWTQTIENFEVAGQMAALFDLFYKFSVDERKLCPMNALVADYNSIPKSMQKSLSAGVEEQRSWTEKMIKRGQKQKIFRRDISAGPMSHSILALAYGSQYLGRAQQNPETIKLIQHTALQFLYV